MRRLLVLVPVLVAIGGCGIPKSTPKPTKPTSEKIDDRNTSYRADGSTLGNAYRAGKRVGLQAEMGEIGKLVMVTVTTENRMPTAEEIKADLKTSAAKLYKLVEDGTIILTDTKSQTGLWAYEIDSDKAGGIALVGGVADRKSADEIKALIAAK